MVVQRIEPDVRRLMGEPDGPFRFVPELGAEVPTYIDPRKDLTSEKAWGFKRLDYHIPFNMRGPFKPQWFDPKYYAQYGQQFKTDAEGFVLCMGETIWEGKTGRKLKEPVPCGNKAVNRYPYCRNHGGALHPADKMLSSRNNQIAKVGQERIDSLDRVQKFMAGLLLVEDLDDDEIIGAYVRNDAGKPINNSKIGLRFQQEMTRELIRRMNRFMQMKLPNMLKAMADIAESDFAEPADRIKASIWLAERVIGKVPDVIVHGTTDKPIDQILGQIQGGSREDFRRTVASTRSDSEPLDVAVVDDEDDLVPDGDTGSTGSPIDRRDGHQSPVGRDDHSNGSSADGDGTDPRVVQRVDSTIAARNQAKQVKRRIKLDKTKRFAMRSQGVTMSGDLAWLIEYRKLKVGFKAILVAPEQQTEAKLAKMSADEDLQLVRIGASNA